MLRDDSGGTGEYLGAMGGESDRCGTNVVWTIKTREWGSGVDVGCIADKAARLCFGVWYAETAVKNLPK